jgi:hypothetical protein
MEPLFGWIVQPVGLAPGSYLSIIIGRYLSSSFFRPGLVSLAYALQPKTRKKWTTGLLPSQPSYGVFPSKLRVRDLLRMKTTVDDSAPQNFAGTLIDLSMHVVAPTTV